MTILARKSARYGIRFTTMYRTVGGKQVSAGTFATRDEAKAGTAEQPYLPRGPVADEPAFIVIYEGHPNEGETAVECCTPLRADATTPDGAATGTIPAHRDAYVRVQKQTVQSGGLGDVYRGSGNGSRTRACGSPPGRGRRTGPTSLPPRQMTRYSTWRCRWGRDRFWRARQRR
jgi:hypothetical protein